MAEGWGRMKRRIGVCSITHGVGVTNTVTSSLAAKLGAGPLLLIGGGHPIKTKDLGMVQELDSVPLMEHVTKLSKRVYSTDRIPEYISMAARYALSGQLGPSYLEIPADIFAQKVDYDSVVFPESYRTQSRPRPDGTQVKKAIELLQKAQRPIIFAGSGIWWSDAFEEVRKLVETMQIPFFADRMGLGTLPSDHRLNFGLSTVTLNEVSCYAAGVADVILVIGTRFDYNLQFGRPPIFNKEAKVIQIDVKAEELGRNRDIEIGIIADIKAAMNDLLEESEGLNWGRDKWVTELVERKQREDSKFQELVDPNKKLIHPLSLIQEIRDFLPDDAIVVSGGGDADFWVHMGYKPNLPGTYFRSESGTLGTSIPYGIGAKCACPDKKVVIICGDGEFGYHCMELETALRYNLPVVVVIENDSCLGMIKRQRQANYGQDSIVGTDLGWRDYHKLVESLGGYGEKVEKIEEVKPALQRAFNSGLPACINVKVDSVGTYYHPHIRHFAK